MQFQEVELQSSSSEQVAKPIAEPQQNGNPQQTATNTTSSANEEGPRRDSNQKSPIRTKGSSKNSSTTGRLLLGNRQDGDDDSLYLTRHRIDHVRQSHGICCEVLLDECVPCCDIEDGRRRDGLMRVTVWWAWSVISSELFLYTLHMLSIAIGALKEVLGLRASDARLALINSCVETIATLLLIIIRMANAYNGYRSVRNTIRHEENFDPGEDIHIRHVRHWMIVFEIIGMILFGFSIGCFFVFLYHLHLGWTILSNNLCMITILVLATLYTARVVAVITRIREDQHKVVIYEAAFIIDEAPVEAGDKNPTLGVKFVRAVKGTKLFEKPDYIILTGDT